MSACARWIQYEYCTLQTVFNVEDTPCSCTLSSFIFESNNSNALPSSDIRMITGQMCDMICDKTRIALEPYELLTLKCHTTSGNIAKGYLVKSLKPPEQIS